jgi:hypothetical protein
MKATWASRDLPVLEAAVRLFEEMYTAGLMPDAADIASATGLDALDVAKALDALDGEYLDLQRTGGDLSSWFVGSITPDARRAVGQWPTGESLIDQLAAGISQAAEREPDPEQKTRLRAVARELAGAAKTIAVNVASEMLEHRLPH